MAYNRVRVGVWMESLGRMKRTKCSFPVRIIYPQQAGRKKSCHESDVCSHSIHHPPSSSAGSKEDSQDGCAGGGTLRSCVMKFLNQQRNPLEIQGNAPAFKATAAVKYFLTVYQIYFSFFIVHHILLEHDAPPPIPLIPGSHDSIFFLAKIFQKKNPNRSRASSSQSGHREAEYLENVRRPKTVLPLNLRLRLRDPGTPEVTVIPTCEEALTDRLKSLL